MYKLLLCLRYVRTRYIALASIISVTLGVATMIVVNAVMSGFTHEMQSRIKGVLSDVSFEARNINEGFPNPEAHMEAIRSVVGDKIAAMTPTVYVPAMLHFQVSGETYTRPIQLIGIDEKTKSAASRFSEYLLHAENRQSFSFQLRENGYDARDRSGGAEGAERLGMETAGWQWRRERVLRERQYRERMETIRRSGGAAADDGALGPTIPPPELSRSGRANAVNRASESATEAPAEGEPATAGELTPEQRAALQNLADLTDNTLQNLPNGAGFEALRQAGAAFVAVARGEIKEQAVDVKDPFDPFAPAIEERVFDPLKEQHTGCVLGIGLISFRRNNQDHFLALPGDDVQITLPTAGVPPKGVSDTFTVVDIYESKMSEYDGAFVFVPIEKLQELRGMFDRESGMRFVTSIQIQLKDDREAELVRDKLRAAFPMHQYHIVTWKDKQGALLAAVQMETAILNVLLFLIIAVAGFGILAIFFMIVVEKTKDIGILKSLGARSGGVMGIFLGYGLSLGILGSGAGLVLGLLLVHYINEIADGLAALTGQEVFDPSIYYFYQIPTVVDAWTVTWIVLGALAIAVASSVIPALRAARLNPVEALRYG